MRQERWTRSSATQVWILPFQLWRIQVGKATGSDLHSGRITLAEKWELGKWEAGEGKETGEDRTVEP